MWCTQCRTAFSWKTGTVETNIHNPHYYEWMRRNNNGVVPRNPGDNGICDVELRHTTVSEIDRIIKLKSHRPNDIEKQLSTKLNNISRNTIHLREVEMIRYVMNAEALTTELRIKYMRNLISKEQFQKQVQQAYKKYEKSREVHALLRLLVTTVTDIIYRAKQDVINCNDGEYVEAFKTLLEVEAITSYTHECLKDIMNTYSCKLIPICNFILKLY
jgi:hypothetical protein